MRVDRVGEVQGWAVFSVGCSQYTAESKLNIVHYCNGSVLGQQQGVHYGPNRIQPLRFGTKGFLMDSFIFYQEALFLFIKGILIFSFEFYRVLEIKKNKILSFYFKFF